MIDIGLDLPKSKIVNHIKEMGASSMKDMGKVMSQLKQKHADALDFSKVSLIIKELLK